MSSSKVVPSDSLKGAMSLMIRQRVRELPVMADGDLVDVISMSDVAKYRLEDLETESNVLRDDIHRARGREAGLALSEGVFERTFRRSRAAGRADHVDESAQGCRDLPVPGIIQEQSFDGRRPALQHPDQLPRAQERFGQSFSRECDA